MATGGALCWAFDGVRERPGDDFAVGGVSELGVLGVRTATSWPLLERFGLVVDWSAAVIGGSRLTGDFWGGLFGSR